MTMHTYFPLFRFLFALLCSTVSYISYSQSVSPVTRFHPSRGQYDFYADGLLSGFMQTAGGGVSSSGNHSDGFLQMPFVGDPLLVYVGEKDSTQFMAYASGYNMQRVAASPNHYIAELTRYGITADISAYPAYVEQVYTYPDTTAAKGFLIDIDHAVTGTANEDMNVVFVDKQTVRAYKRTRLPSPQASEFYYVAHFSVPFDTWNVRRERVTLENGEKEARCKVAFTFRLKKGERLHVQSAVSSVSTDAAYAHLPGERAQRHFDDRRASLVGTGDPCPSSQNKMEVSATSGEQKISGSGRAGLPMKPRQGDLIEISTRDATLRLAFYDAMSRLRRLPELRQTTSAADFVERLSKLYPSDQRWTQGSAAKTDSLLRCYISDFLRGHSQPSMPELRQLDEDGRAAWLVFSALGIRPQHDGYELLRPAFNVATLYMKGGRRMVLYVKRASLSRRRVTAVSWAGVSLPAPYRLTSEQLRRGGMLEVTMEE